MIKVECSAVSCFWGPGKSPKDEIVLTTDKQLEILKNAPREARNTSYYFVHVYEDDFLIESFSCDYCLTDYLRKEKEVVDIFAPPFTKS